MGIGHVLGDAPGAWADFTHDGRKFRARRDPMWVGAEVLATVLEKPGVLLGAFDDRSRERALIGDVFGTRLPALVDRYLTEVGLSVSRLGLVVFALEHIEDLEVDLLRVGLDVRDWLAPEGGVSTRRVCVLIEDFQERPETRLGALRAGIYPISKAGIAAAQQFNHEGHVHPFLWSREKVESDRRARVDEEAKRRRIAERMKTRGG